VATIGAAIRIRVVVVVGTAGADMKMKGVADGAQE
jgi:hypothetical protein